MALLQDEEYNIGFGYPRSDTCEKCYLLKLAGDNAKTEEERSEVQTELASHHQKAAQGYASLRADSHRSKLTLVHVWSPLTFNKIFQFQR